jgi:hypothetical protein
VAELAATAVPDASAGYAPVPGALRSVLAALEGCGIPVALLRGFEATAPSVEVDLLVRTVGRSELTAPVAACGFAPLRAWGHGGHRFFLGYSAADHLWLKLDFITRLPGADAELVLAERRHIGCLPLLERDVEGALLLLHCIVDKGGRLGRHRATLRRLAVQPPSPPPGASEALRRLWPALWKAVAGSGSTLPGGLTARVADLVAPGRARRVRRDRWLRRASYLRRAVRPVAPTVVVRDPALDGHGRALERLVRELGPGARGLSVPEGRGAVALVRRRLKMEMARRRNDAPVVVYTGVEASGLAKADITVPAGDGEGSGTALADRVSEAVWGTYRQRLLGGDAAVTRAARAADSASTAHRA